MNQILIAGKPSVGRNVSATVAFHKFRNGQSRDSEEEERGRLVKLGVEMDQSMFRGLLYLDVISSFTCLGPPREKKPYAIQDAIEMGRVFIAEGSDECKKIAMRLRLVRYGPDEIEISDEADLLHFCRAGLQRKKPDPVKRLIPPGEGWVRHDEEKLVNPQSQIYFVQVGKRAGQYLKRECAETWSVITAPHKPTEQALSLSAASASFVRTGAKLERAVILNDITKIARLALRFPLSFVDLPACAFALFQGFRSAESAQCCAENFHKKLLPMVAEKIHSYEASELEDVLRRSLEALDAELLKSSHAFSGVGALVAIVLGDRIALAGVGPVRAVLLSEKKPPQRVVTCKGALGSSEASQAESKRMLKAGGVVRDGAVYGTCEGLDEATRILAAPHAFEVLQIELGGPSDEKQVRSAYRRLALRVHPDKQAEGVDKDSFKAAFERLDTSKESLEAMLSVDTAACRELHRALRCDAAVHTRQGAAELLGVDKVPTLDTGQVEKEAGKASRELKKKLERMRGVSSEYGAAVALCDEAVATLGRGCTPEALPRQEALLREGLATSRAMGARDLRWPRPIVVMQPESASLQIPSGGGGSSLALLCGATAALSDEYLAECVVRFSRRPKAAALRCCLDSDASASSSSAVFIKLDGAHVEELAAKRQRTVGTVCGKEGMVRLRHILFKHQQLRQGDPMARREGKFRTAQEAEKAALDAFEKLLQDRNQFLRLCRELSDCQSADQPGMLSGDLGWVARGQLEPCVDDDVFALRPNDFGDLVSSSRGVHIFQRLA